MEAFVQQTVSQGEVVANMVRQSQEFQPSGRLADPLKVLQIMAEEAWEHQADQRGHGTQRGMETLPEKRFLKSFRRASKGFAKGSLKVPGRRVGMCLVCHAKCTNDCGDFAAANRLDNQSKGPLAAGAGPSGPSARTSVAARDKRGSPRHPRKASRGSQIRRCSAGPPCRQFRKAPARRQALSKFTCAYP